MCPPLSCCHGRSMSPLSAPLHHLVRLLLAEAAPHELAEAERATLPAFQQALWQQLQQAVQAHYRASVARADELLEQLVQGLLLEDCCRQSVRRAVPLAEALGLAHATRWDACAAL